MRDIAHFVNGQALVGTSGRYGDVFNPNTGEVQARVQFATDAELDAAVQVAAKAQVGWAQTNPQRRMTLPRFVMRRDLPTSCPGM